MTDVLEGIRILEVAEQTFVPAASAMLADFGAEVIKIEPPGGERTRRLRGFGTGYFSYFNRNKKSLVLDYKTETGLADAKKLVSGADVLIENMAPGAMKRAGLGAEDARELNPNLIYCSLKGFLPGPYENRVALDEIAQMMSGLAYMTGPPGMPLRAGTSVTDMLGAMFGAIGILVALRERDRGVKRGAVVESALFETAVFLMGQFMAYSAIRKEPVPPMPARISAWGVYDLFEAAEGRRVFVGVTSDAHWLSFCREFGRPDLSADPTLATNEARVDERARLLPILAEMFKKLPSTEIERRCIVANLPFALIARPEDLFDDPHLNASGGLLNSRLPGGVATKLPALPIRIDRERFELRSDPPDAGADTLEILQNLRSDAS